MAKNDKSAAETALSTLGGTSPGALLMAEDDFARFIGEGFASIESVVMGDPAEGKQPMYVGVLIGPGSPMEMEPDPKTGEVRSMKTFAFHPMAKTADGGYGPAMNVTHILPASYIIANACERIGAQAEKEGKTAIVALIFNGQTKTRRGFRLNQYRVYEKYV